LGETIRSYRKTSGLSREKLAERADRHHNYIGELEHGEKAGKSGTVCYFGGVSQFTLYENSTGTSASDTNFARFLSMVCQPFKKCHFSRTDPFILPFYEQ
jgi:transcriptional regulator with XRE-family HTH domain